MDFPTMQCARVAKKFFAVALLIGGLAGCASESGDTAAPSAVREPPTSPSNPPANNAPVISGNPAASAQVGVTYTFQPSATDAETPSGQLVYAISGCPVWATCTNGSGANAGRITGMPQTGHVGLHSGIVVSVLDTQGNAATLPAFSITVAATANQAPTITGTPPASVQVNSAYSFTPTVTDPDGPSRSFTFTNFPVWMTTRNASTGLISGTPVAGQEGTYSNLRINISDGTNSRTLGPFTITVTALPTTNQPPVISGSPPTSIVAGLLYSFTPTASDPNAGSTLTFSITNRPLWSTFDPVTGTLSGLALFGTTSNIVISVRDPQGATAALQPFAINVTAVPPTGTATVSWTAPTTNTDDTPLTNLAGFWVLYGTNANSLNQQVRIASATATSHTVNALASGTWYFAVRAYNSSDVQSDLSNVSSKVIP
jgi:hypothetical protein